MPGNEGVSMVLLLLTGVLLLVVGGCACVVWAARGGPPWTRAVAQVTLVAGESVRSAGRSGRSGGHRGGDDDSDG